MNRNERLRELVAELASVLNEAITDNDQVQDTIKSIESEGYEIDLLLATFTRIQKKDDTFSPNFTSYDRSFLRSLKIDPEGL